MPNYVKRDIVTALVDPLIDYGNIITYGWGVHGTVSEECRVRVLDNDKIRYVFGLKRHEHITEYRDRLGALTPDERARVHSASLIYKHLNGNLPTYLNDLFVNHNSNTRSNGHLQVIRPRTTFDTRAFCYSAVLFWNSIPEEIRRSLTFGAFKDNIKNWIRLNRK